jgi:hypothetical protein
MFGLRKYFQRLTEARKSRERFRSYVSPELVDQILRGEVPESNPRPLPPKSVIPYALIHVFEEPLESIPVRMGIAIQIVEKLLPQVVSEMVLSSVLLASFYSRAERPASEKLRDETVDTIMRELEGQCQVLTGNIYGYRGVLGSRSVWFGTLCPGILELFDKLKTVPLGSAVRFDLGN